MQILLLRGRTHKSHGHCAALPLAWFQPREHLRVSCSRSVSHCSRSPLHVLFSPFSLSGWPLFLEASPSIFFTSELSVKAVSDAWPFRPPCFPTECWGTLWFIPSFSHAWACSVNGENDMNGGGRLEPMRQHTYSLGIPKYWRHWDKGTLHSCKGHLNDTQGWGFVFENHSLIAGGEEQGVVGFAGFCVSTKQCLPLWDGPPREGLNDMQAPARKRLCNEPRGWTLSSNPFSVWSTRRTWGLQTD